MFLTSIRQMFLNSWKKEWVTRCQDVDFFLKDTMQFWNFFNFMCFLSLTTLCMEHPLYMHLPYGKYLTTIHISVFFFNTVTAYKTKIWLDTFFCRDPCWKHQSPGLHVKWFIIIMKLYVLYDILSPSNRLLDRKLSG